MTPGEELEWKLLTDLLEARYGLVFPGVRLEILRARLNARLQALHLETFLEYYHYLRSHPDREAEFVEVVRRTTNNETYFLREPHHFDIVVRHLIPELGPVLRQRPLRVLSAACSSGEEPYSLVIALQQAGVELTGVQWQIDACDLNVDRLEQARRATYEAGSLRACSEDDKIKLFTAEGSRYVLKERYRKGVRFVEANLAAPFSGLGAQSYDAIFCRNLLIYLSETAIRALVDRFARLLLPGGLLLLGHAESLIDKSADFAPVVLEGVVVYRRVAAQ